jgi:hypothetical protein
VNATDLTHDELVDAIRRTPNMSPTALAARQLIVDTDVWLHRPDFIDTIEIEVWAGTIYAKIDWQKAAPVADTDADPHEIAVLRLALLLSGVFTDTPAPWSLRDTLAEIHWAHAAAVMAAVATALSGDRV